MSGILNIQIHCSFDGRSRRAVEGFEACSVGETMAFVGACNPVSLAVRSQKVTGTCMHVQVGIVGAGPAGLLLARLLQSRRNRQHHPGTTLARLCRKPHSRRRARTGHRRHHCKTADVADRLTREGLVHHGINLSLNGVRRHINLHELSGGKAVTVYGQTEVTKDLIAANLAQLACRSCLRHRSIELGDLDSNRPT